MKAGNVIETHEPAGRAQGTVRRETKSRHAVKRDG